MSQRVVSTLQDLASRHGGCVAVQCEDCGRKARFWVGDLSAYARHRGLADRWPDFAQWIVCSGCGRRRPKVMWSDNGEWLHDYPPVKVPAPAPIGVSQKAWNAADERGRRRLVRIARG